MSRQPELVTLPAAIDPHFHGRSPSPINKSETFASGSRAMMLGGFAVIMDMSNTPGLPTYYPERSDDKHKLIERTAFIPMATAAGSQPEEDNIADFTEMAKRSIFLKSYLGKTTGNPNEYDAEDFFEIWERWHEASAKPIFVHRGSADLEKIIAEVAGELNHHLHICHTSYAGEVEMVKKAKRQGLPVSIGVTPHHLFMTSHDLFSRDSFADMMPPLARQVDAERLWYETVHGGIDWVETDHAPHSKETKMAAAQGNGECKGVPGGEFTQSLLLRRTMKEDEGFERLSPERYVEITSGAAQRVLNIKLAPTTEATWDMTEFRYETDNKVQTQAGWNPFLGMLAAGKLVRLQIGDKALVEEGVFTGRRAARAIMGEGETI